MHSSVRARWKAALLSVVLIASLAGCGGGGGGRGASTRAQLPLPAEPMTVAMKEPGRYGGRFVLGQTSSAKTFNPHLGSGSATTDVLNRMYSSLVDIDYNTLEDIPQIAKSWDVSTDQTTYTFHLRRGLAFSDGHAITSDDVKFSFDVVLDDSAGVPLRSLFLVNGKPWEVSAPDSYTVVIRVPEPFATVLPNAGAVRILPRHRLEAAWKAGQFASAYGTNTPPESLVVSGPFKLQEFVPDQKTVLVPNPHWFGVDAKGQRLPYLDELVFLIVKDQDAAALRFHAGELDALDNVKPEDYAAFEKQQKAEKYTLYDIGPSLNTNFFWFNLNRVREPKPGRRVGDPEVERYKYAWFADPVFRRAVSHAIDRDAIARGPLYGFGVKNFAVYTVANKLWHPDSVPAWDFDRAEARRLLASRGFRDVNGDSILEDAQGHRVSFTLQYNSDNNVRKAMAELIQSDLRQVGIELIPQGIEFKALTTHLDSDYQYEACLLGQQTSVPPDPGIGGSFWLSSGRMHYWWTKQAKPGLPVDQRLDALFTEANRPAQHDVRKRASDEMQRVLNEECLLIWLPTQINRLPVRDRFGNIDPNSMPHRILWNADRIFDRGGEGGR